MNWTHGQNSTQEYFVAAGAPGFQIVRNLGQRSWVIYDFNGGGVRMIPNPGTAQERLSFCEVTDLPAQGEQFGDRPHHDRIQTAQEAVNYAWDSADEAMGHVEAIHR